MYRRTHKQTKTHEGSDGIVSLELCLTLKKDGILFMFSFQDGEKHGSRSGLKPD